MKIFPIVLALTGIASAEVTIVPHPDVDCQPGKTIVWTAAIQSAFDRIIGPKAALRFVKIEPPNPVVLKMRTFVWKEDEILPKDGWFAVTGKASDELAADATARWRRIAGPGQPAFAVTHEPNPGYAASFIGIKRDFAFARAFSTSRDKRMEWGSEKQPVKFFGARRDAAADYSDFVKVLAYRPGEHLKALQFSAVHGDDKMILYTPKEGQSMLEAMTWVRAWRGQQTSESIPGSHGWDDPSIHDRDELRAPEMLLQRDEDMVNLFAGDLHFKGVAGTARISQATSTMKLAVDATGVRFQATVAIQDPFVPAKPAPFPRKFWFDQPFFLFLWRDGAVWPYAAVWFGDTEGLVKL